MCVDNNFGADRNNLAGKAICTCDDDKHDPENLCFANGLVHVEDGDSSSSDDIHIPLPGEPGFVNGKGPLLIQGDLFGGKGGITFDNKLGAGGLLGAKIGTRPGEPGFVNGKGPLPIKNALFNLKGG